MSPRDLKEMIQRSGDWEKGWTCFLGLNKIRVSELEELLRHTG